MSTLAEFENLIPRISGNSITLHLDYPNHLSLHPIIDHIKNYPKLEWQDVYKFVLQGSCGWTHLLSGRNQEEVVQHLNNELNRTSKPLPDERLFDILNNETALCRINLRVWKNENVGKLHELWNLMMKAEKSTPESSDNFKINWRGLVDLSEKGNIMTSKREGYLVHQWMKIVLKLTETIENSSKMPLIHHSETYRTSYKPSYRLVNKNDLLEYLKR